MITVVTRVRWVALAVGLYLGLDVTNPELPGAVQLVDGALDTVAACQARSVEARTDLVRPLARQLSTTEPRIEQYAPLRPVATVPLPPASLHASPDPRSTLPSSLDDD